MKAVLNRFRAAGYEIWLDDFGSGYSSLNILKDYPVDLIKLDLAFLHSFEVNPQVSVIISYVVHMAKTMGIHTLCEGVETREEYDFLKFPRDFISAGRFLWKKCMNIRAPVIWGLWKKQICPIIMMM